MVTQEELEKFRKDFNQKNKGRFHELKPLHPSLYKGRMKKSTRHLQGKTLYYEEGEKLPDIYFNEEYIEHRLKVIDIL